MQNYQPLVFRSLELLFRHFSQWSELSQIIDQVQLLVSDDDIKNYSSTQNDLDYLHLLIEKSELWLPNVSNLKKENQKTNEKLDSSSRLRGKLQKSFSTDFSTLLDVK